MADFYTQKGPTVSATIARHAAPAQIDISKALSTIDRFAGAVGATVTNTAALAKAQADGDFLKQQFNPTDARDEAIYRRTYRSRENAKWFDDINSEIEKSLTDPSHWMAEMSDQEFSVWYQEATSKRLNDLADDSAVANTQNDFTAFMAEQGPKLQANHAKVRRAVNQEKIIRETSLAVSGLMVSKGQTLENLRAKIAELPGLAVVPKETKDNLLMSAATYAAEAGVGIGIEYLRNDVLPGNPDMIRHLETAEAMLQRTRLQQNSKSVFDMMIKLNAAADAAQVTEGTIRTVRADPTYDAITDEQLIGWLDSSNRNKAKAEADFYIKNTIANKGVPNVSEADLGKALNQIWHETLDAYGGNFREAVHAYVKAVKHVGMFGSDFTGAIERSLSTAFETPGDSMPPNDWMASVLTAATLIDSGNVDLLDLSEDNLLAVNVAATAFENHRSKDGTLAPVNEAAQAAYRTFSTFKKKKAEGVLPDYIQDKFRFSALVDKKLREKTQTGTFMKVFDFLNPFMKIEEPDAITSEVVARVKDTAYMMAVNNNYPDVDTLLDLAVGKVKKDYVVVHGKLQRQPRRPLHSIMGISKESLQAANQEFISSKFLKESFPGHAADELNIDVVGVGMDAAFIVSSLKDPNMSPIHVPAAHVGQIYKETLAKKQAEQTAHDAKDLRGKRLAAKQSARREIDDFTMSIAPGGSRADMVPESFKKLYYNSTPEVKHILAAGWINAYDKAAQREARIVFGSLDPGGFRKPYFDSIKQGKADVAAHRAAVAQRRRDLEEAILAAGTLAGQKKTRELAAKLGISAADTQAALGDALTVKRAIDTVRTVQNAPWVDDVMAEAVPNVVTRALITGYEADMQAAERKSPDKFKIPKEVHSAVSKQHPVNQGAWDHLREGKFLDAYSTVAVNEGRYGWDTNGAQVFMGINRKSWPNWSGWKLVDAVVRNNEVFRTTAAKNQALDTIADDPVIRTKVAEFYHKNFYKPLKLDKIQDTALRTTIMDLAVRGGAETYNKILRQTIRDLGGTTSVSTEPLTQGHINFINKNSTAFFNAFFTLSEQYTSGLNVPSAARQAWEPRNALLRGR